MKPHKIIQIISFLLLGMFFYSCSNELDKNNNTLTGTDDIPVSFEISTRQNIQNVGCMLYVFEKENASGSYAFKYNVSLDGNLPVSFPFRNNEIYGKYYRFLFVATPVSAAEIAIRTKLDGAIQTGTLWSDIMMKMTSDSISQHNYYGILDKTGSQIMDDGKITGNLQRIVGQYVFDFYRAGTGIDNPVSIQSAAVASVLDRVYQIDIQYERPTSAITFDENGNILSEIKGKPDIIHTLKPALQNYGVNIPQSNIGLERHSSGVNGAVSLQGACMMQATGNMHVKMTFYYYDTSPTCGTGTETTYGYDCYEKKELVLHFPKNNDSLDSLSIKPNYYTQNRAGIIHDRIIDLGVTGGAQIFTAWDVTNN